MLLPENHFHWAPAGKQQQKAVAGALLIYFLNRSLRARPKATAEIANTITATITLIRAQTIHTPYLMVLINRL